MSGGAGPAPRRGDEFALALKFDRRVAIRAATETTAIPAGCVIRHADLPEVHSLNGAMLDAPLPRGFDAATLARLADRWLEGLEHRFVRVDDEAAADRLAPALLASGWQRRRTVMMVRSGSQAAPAPDPRASEASGGEHEALMLANFEEADYGVDASPGLARRLVDAQLAMLAATDSRCFGAGEDGGLQSMCELYLDPDVEGVRIAMVEQVATLTGYRERGLAKAVVAGAIAAAAEWRAQLITVPADADDWPQIIYAGLGFAPVGLQNAFILRRPSGGKLT